MIAICLPSRGLIHSRTVEGLFKATQDHNMQLFFSHDNPIPECFNVTCQAALDAGCDPILILEEDVVLQEDTLTNMLKLIDDYEVVYCNYPLGNGLACREINDTFYLATGCTMFNRSTLEQLMPFEAKYAYHARTKELMQVLDQEAVHNKVYGLHDQYMSLRMHELGMNYAEAGMVGHWHVSEYGRPMVNDGRHKLIELGGEEHGD